MSTFRLSAVASSAALAAVLLSSTAGLAAPSGSAAAFAGHQGPLAMSTPIHGHPMPQRGVGLGRADHTEGRIAFLKAELKITDDQTPQWEAVAKAMRDQSAALAALHTDMRAERKPAESKPAEGERDRAERRPALTAPEALAEREKALAARAKALAVTAEGQRQFAAAFGALYERLSDDQKKVADQLLAGRRHRT